MLGLLGLLIRGVSFLTGIGIAAAVMVEFPSRPSRPSRPPWHWRYLSVLLTTHVSAESCPSPELPASGDHVLSPLTAWPKTDQLPPNGQRQVSEHPRRKPVGVRQYLRIGSQKGA
jgi:hypothetical protein